MRWNQQNVDAVLALLREQDEFAYVIPNYPGKSFQDAEFVAFVANSLELIVEAVSEVFIRDRYTRSTVWNVMSPDLMGKDYVGYFPLARVEGVIVAH